MQDIYTNLFKDENGELKIFSIAEISNILKQTIEAGFSKIRIRGEITGLKKHQSGHYYFDLKEKFDGKDFILNGIVWKWTKLSCEPEEGMEVIIDGKISVYTGRSSYNITVEAMEIAGEGALLKLIEDRKKRLAAEGLFDESRKKPLPKLPKIIGVITSETGSVLQDIRHRIAERFPTRILLWAVPVQGEHAHNFIADAINGFNKIADLNNRPDVIIVARGGGSLQDLMPFNEECVVRATAESQIPIISAVGHETDTTLIDFASDRRAPTPTGAAEIAVPVRAEIIQDLDNKQNRINNTILRIIKQAGEKITQLKARLKSPIQIIEDLSRRIMDKSDRINNAIKNKMQTATTHLEHSKKLLESYSYTKVLKRGFAVIRGDNGKLVSNLAAAKSQSALEIEFHDGRLAQTTTLSNQSQVIENKDNLPKYIATTSAERLNLKITPKRAIKEKKNDNSNQGNLF